MNRIFLVMLVLCAAVAGSIPACAAQTGTLMLIGGGERDNNPLLWPEFVRLAGGAGKRVLVFPTASAHPERSGSLYANFFRSLGLESKIVPLSAKFATPKASDIVGDPQWLDTVRNADALFFAGGDQALYRQSLMAADGSDTPLLGAVRAAYRRGALVAGTSAGMAVMSRLMFIEAESMIAVLQNGARMGREIDHGFGLMPDAWLLDQHFLTRSRFARSLVAMQQHGFELAIGVDEDTALIVERGARARVVGYRGVIVMDATRATRDAGEARFNWHDVRLSYLSHDDRIDLQTRVVTVGPEKRGEFRIDPRARDFEPYYTLPQFRTDIFANSTLLDLMVQLVDSPFDEAIGLGFDGNAARHGPSEGFEFRFSRIDSTVSWDSASAIGDPNTVLDVRLDIRPILINGPLYR